MTGLAEEVARYGSVAVAGLAKNVGKTVTLNHILREAYRLGLSIGVTSIGIDGESLDQVTKTAKPEITVFEGMMFATTETHYRGRRLISEVLDVGKRHTSLGRVVTAKALSTGKALLSGPSDTGSLCRLIGAMHRLGSSTVVVDGALSRLSPASPAVTEAMILATGAALSPSIPVIVSKTAFVCQLVELPEVEKSLAERLETFDEVCTIDDEGMPRSTGVKSAIEIEKVMACGFEGISAGRNIYVPGMIGDRFIKFLTSRLKEGNIELIIRDFTRIFVDPVILRGFMAGGGSIKVLRRPRLIGVTVNPWSPGGYRVDGEELLEQLRQRLSVPVVNVMKE